VLERRLDWTRQGRRDAHHRAARLRPRAPCSAVQRAGRPISPRHITADGSRSRRPATSAPSGARAFRGAWVPHFNRGLLRNDSAGLSGWRRTVVNKVSRGGSRRLPAGRGAPSCARWEWPKTMDVPIRANSPAAPSSSASHRPVRLCDAVPHVADFVREWLILTPSVAGDAIRSVGSIEVGARGRTY